MESINIVPFKGYFINPQNPCQDISRSIYFGFIAQRLKHEQWIGLTFPQWQPFYDCSVCRIHICAVQSQWFASGSPQQRIALQ